MYNNRPRIKVPFAAVDIIVEFVSITLLILMWIYCVINFNKLPDIIATHFNVAGEPDGFGSNYTIWFVPMIATFIYVGLFMLNRYPYMHNYMVDITKENALKNYRFSTRVVRLVNFLCILLMAYITYMMIQSAFGEQFNLTRWFVPLVVGFSIILPIVIIIYMKKLNK